MNLRDETTVVVLAGGKSRRMGRDKALLPHANGQTWIQNIVSLVSGRSTQIFIATGEQKKYTDLSFTPNVQVVADDRPDRGPLGGVLTALRMARTQFVLAVTCDMPAVKPEHFERLGFPNENESIVFVEGTFFPFMIRNSKPIRTGLQKRISEGDRSVRGFLSSVRSRSIWIPSALRLNYNRPEDARDLGPAIL